MPRVIISAGKVLDNIDAPPAGGCVVSVMVKLDNVTDMLAYPGFHQLFVYGYFKRELRGFLLLDRYRTDGRVRKVLYHGRCILDTLL